MVESFSEMFCFKVKCVKSIWNFHWSKILLQRHRFSTTFPFDLTYPPLKHFANILGLHMAMPRSQKGRSGWHDFIVKNQRWGNRRKSQEEIWYRLDFHLHWTCPRDCQSFQTNEVLHSTGSWHVPGRCKFQDLIIGLRFCLTSHFIVSLAFSDSAI